MSFGWSVDDLITALKLLHQVGAVLKDAGGASSDFQDRVSFLETLSRTLQHLNTLQTLPLDAGVAKNLREQCDHVQGPLRHFLDDIKSSFEPTLGSSSNINQFLATPRKIQWALTVSKKIKGLQDRIATPVASIGLILGQQVIQTTLEMPSVIQKQIAHTLATAIDSDLRPITTQISSQLENLAASQSDIIKGVFQQTLESRTHAANLYNKLNQIDVTSRSLEHSLQKISLSQNIPTTDSSSRFQYKFLRIINTLTSIKSYYPKHHHDIPGFPSQCNGHQCLFQRYRGDRYHHPQYGKGYYDTELLLFAFLLVFRSR